MLVWRLKSELGRCHKHLATLTCSKRRHTSSGNRGHNTASFELGHTPQPRAASCSSDSQQQANVCFLVGAVFKLYIQAIKSVCARACAHAHACMCVHIKASSVFCNHPLSYFLRQGLSANLQLTVAAKLAGQQVPRIFLSPSPALELQAHTATSDILHGSWRAETYPQAGTEATWPNEPSPWYPKVIPY